MSLSYIVVKTREAKRSLYLLGLCFVIPSLSQALQLDANVYSGTEYTSNARLASTNTVSDVIERVGVNVLLREERKRFNANARFNLSQEYYLNNTFSDETQLTTGFGLFNFDIVEDFLDWRTSFTRNDVLVDSTLGDTPSNREQRNTFRTGPNINYRINKASILNLGANFIQVENSSDIAADTKRVDANTSYIYQYNSTTNFSLNGVYDEVIESDQGSVVDSDNRIKNTTINVGMNRQFSHGMFSINAGQNQVRSDTADTITGNFFNIVLQRDQFFSHNLNIRYSESISDSSIGFGTIEELLAANPNLSLMNPQLETTSQLDIIKRKRLDILVNRNLGSYQYNITSFLNDLNYDIQENDERSIGFSLGIRQQIREGLTAGFTFQQVNQTFLDQINVGDNVTQTYTIDSSYRWTEDFSTDFFMVYDHRRNHKNPNREYERFSVRLYASWALF